MHKKSIEASKKLQESDKRAVETEEKNSDIRSESLATLRAKAQEHVTKQEFTHPHDVMTSLPEQPMARQQESFQYGTPSGLQGHLQLACGV